MLGDLVHVHLTGLVVPVLLDRGVRVGAGHGEDHLVAGQLVGYILGCTWSGWLVIGG